MTWGFTGAPWKPRVQPRFNPSTPAARALIDATVPVLTAHRAGLEVAAADQLRWLKALRQAAYADRVRKRAYSSYSDGLGDTQRLEVAAIGALRYAAALVELRDARLRDHSIGDHP
jgi:hypothetical protein